MDSLAEVPVTVTGGTGFVGSHLIERLVAVGARVRCLLRRTSSLKYLPREGVDLVYGDLATGEGLQAAFDGARLVFHVAGVTKARTRQAFFDGNLRGTVNVLAACGAVERFVHVSSLAAVGPSPDGKPLTEDAAPHPRTWYGESKLEAEQAVRTSPLAPRAVILRPPVVYGPRDTDVFEIFRSVRRGVMLRIGRGASFFSYIYVKDLAEALIRAACSECAAGRTYFAANEKPASWTEFGTAIAAAMNRSVRFVDVPGPVAAAAGWCADAASRFRTKPWIISRQKVLEARCRYWTCDSSRASEQLGFSASYALDQGIRETIAWYRETGWLKP